MANGMTDDKDKMLLEHWQLLTAGGRLRGERSRALPAHAYRDPADTFEFPSERQRREEAKRVARAKRRGKR
jgi:hypothetical protein